MVIKFCFPCVEGTTEENLDKLIQNVQIESDSDMIRNWKYLDVPVISSVRICLFCNFLPAKHLSTALSATLSSIIQVFCCALMLLLLLFL